MNNKLKLINALIGPIGFIMMGIYLIQKTERIAIIIGYVDIFVWSVLLLFTLYKIAKRK
jgi:hypothetical protein